jgi:hypothetical protein
MKPLPRLSTPLSAALRRLFAAMLGVALAAPVLAQWAWKDDAGRTVYSDQPPPATVKKDQILRQPPGGAISAPSAGGTRPATPAAPRTVAEQEQEFRKRQQERAEAEKKQAEQQAMNARKAQECERARGYVRLLEDGMRIARTDAQGNREYLDDTQRAAEMARAREVISANCN